MTTYGRRADHISAYTFHAETICPDCMHAASLEWDDTTPAAADMSTEDVLEQVAAYRLIDRQDESTFDSDDFPKVVFSSQIDEPESCDRCGAELY